MLVNKHPKHTRARQARPTLALLPGWNRVLTRTRQEADRPYSQTSKVSEFRPSLQLLNPRRPRLTSQKFRQTVDRPRKPVPAGTESDAEMGSHPEAIAGREHHAALSQPLAELPRVAPVHQPGKRRHASAGSNPLQHFRILREKRIEYLKILDGNGLAAIVDGFPIPQCQRRESFAQRRVRNREITARVQIAFPARGIAFDDPPGPQAAEA